MYHIFFIHSVDRHLDYFKFVAIMNRAAMNMVLVILMGVRQNLKVAFICIFLVKDIEHFFKCFSAI